MGKGSKREGARPVASPNPSAASPRAKSSSSVSSSSSSSSAAAGAAQAEQNVALLPKIPPFAASLLRLAVFLGSLLSSVLIRLFAVQNYGRVIHEFDPWFNFRATQYLVDHGWSAFISWYDYEAWYPLGRPVGTTIYPGMQVTAAWIYWTLNGLGFDVSLNDVCVFIPAGFAVITVTFTFLLAYEVSSSANAATAAAAIMAILPAHLMRSVAGGYDNESVAVAAICSTFYFWVRSVRTNSWSFPFAFVTAISYIYMVAAWGGYTFVLNMIGVHAVLLLVLGRYSVNLHLAYSIFYVIGTIGALQFPIVGWQPLQSMEQLGPMGVFFLMQAWGALESYRKSSGMTNKEFNLFRIKAVISVGITGLVALYFILPEGFVGPLSARVRGLFVAHTRTGNPLVDSVAEHQATPMEVYFKYFHVMHYFGPMGLVLLAHKAYNGSNAALFGAAFFVIAGYFSTKMIRLVLLLSPASSVCAGLAMSSLFEWAYSQLTTAEAAVVVTAPAEKRKRGKTSTAPTNNVTESLRAEYVKNTLLRRAFAIGFLVLLGLSAMRYVPHSLIMAQQLSHPSIMIQGRSRDGSIVMIDDFREAYWWLRDNTPEDSRVLAWWDYGYQINGIANRTTIADGNTWNHEHIALLGKALVSDEIASHRIVRHLADYVLVWSTRYGGMQGDDLAKMPHMARIGGSVYDDIPQDGYWQDQYGNPSELMRKSLLYQLHSYRLRPDVPPPTRYEEAFTSEHNMVRIYKVKNVDQESKKWCEEHRGQYPPALAKIVAKKKDFKQIH